MTLYEINEKMNDLVDPESGELKDYDAYLQLQMDKDTKIENTVLWIKDLQAEATAIKAEEQKLADRRKSAENKAERLKEYLRYALDGEKFSTPRCSVSYRKVSSLAISDEEGVIAWAERNDHYDCLKFREPTVLKTVVTEYIKQGTEVPFCAIQERQAICIK